MINHMDDNPFKSHLAVEEYYETAISKFSPERIETYHRMAREGIPAIDLEYMRSGFTGLEYRKLIQKTIHTSSCDELLRIIAGFYSAFTPVERTAVRELLQTHDRRALDADFWHTDCAKVLDGICEFLEGLPDPFEDRIKYAMFELVSNNLAVIALNVAEVREIARIRKDWFPERN